MTRQKKSRARSSKYMEADVRGWLVRNSKSKLTLREKEQ